jgi:hypothetical protein
MAQILNHPATILPDLARIAAEIRHEAPVLLAVLAAAITTGSLLTVSVRSARQRQLARGARLIEVSVPPTVEPGASQALWAHLLGLHRPAWRRIVFGQVHLGFELTATADGLLIRIWIPGVVPPGFVEHAVESAWPGARTLVLDETAPPLKVGAGTRIEAGRLLPSRTAAVPLRTSFDTDPLRQLLGAVAAHGHGEAGCVQILARPASPRRARRLRRSLPQLSGRQTGPRFSLGRVLAEFVPGPRAKPNVYSSGAPWRDARTDADARAAATKLGGSLWEAEIRYAATVTAPGSAPSSSVRSRCQGLAGEIASAFGVYADRNYLRRKHLHRSADALASRVFRRGVLYSIPEIAALAHLPYDAVVPGLARAGARPVPPSIRIPATGATSSLVVLGDADAGPARPVALQVPDGRHHLHVIGATGSGKSTLLAQLALQDIDAHRGTVVIDPNGDLVTTILDQLPTGAVARTVLIDPELDAPPPQINPLDGAEPAVAVDNLTSIFQRIYQGFWGPRSDDLLRASCLTLIAAHASNPGLPAPSLGQIPLLLTSDPTRRRYVNALSSRDADPAETQVLAGFWAWYEQLSAPSRANVTAPLLNKLRAFLLRDFAAQMVATKATSIDLAGVLDGGICLVRLPKGVLGVETVRLLGSFVVAKFWQAATARAQVGTVRRDAAITVDECHNFLNLAIPPQEMLAEARAYRYHQRLAHQNLAQLPAPLREGLSTNARNKVVFSVSPEDAGVLERHTLPALRAHDLANLDAFQAAARLTVNAAEQPAFTLRTRPLPEPSHGHAAEIRNLIAGRVRAERTQTEPENT